MIVAQQGLGGSFTADARIAITAAPDYFVWWYTAKSIALVAALGALAYMAGRRATR